MKNLLNSNKKGQPPSSVSGFASSSSSKPSINPSCRDPSDGFELQTDLPTLTLSAFVEESERRNPGFLKRCRSFAERSPAFLLKSFQTSCGAGWKGVEDLNAGELVDRWKSTADLRHYDFVCYVFWRVAADDISQSRDRLALLNEVGKQIYVQTCGPGSSSSSSSNSSPLTQITPTLKALLEKFKSANLVESYRVVSGEAIEAVESFKPFDYLDDEDIVKGNDVNLVLSIRKPATLTSALQVNNEQSLFQPEFTAPAVSQCFLANGLNVKPVQTYFVDSVYRQDPNLFFPDEELLQFTISK
ncbi:hypothetical protein TrVE_jg13503 [Triparma verrucosa]|uniref:Uncharacterized protein n=1 Tax=Triparma verrucosa TaxID=1606542 RepID=A0A9W7BG73_9STRA|nr:hypothetical protein TrVE_jg13503 [Triparma verrucosa]